MKAKSRRRLLVSSVAMLLVAMLALGTATFAWFTTDTTTTARGVKVQTSKNSTIQVSSRTSKWTNDLDYGFNKTLSPISSANGKDWFYTVAAGPDAAKASDAPTANFGSFKTTDNNNLPTSTDAEKYMFYNMLNVKNVGSAPTEKAVHIKATLTETAVTSGKNYLRLALVPATAANDADRLTATVKSDSDFTDNIYSVTTDDKAKPVASMTSSGVITEGAEITAKGADIDIDLGVLDANQAKYYMLIIWFEGQDDDCYDVNSGNALGDITFTIAEEV